MGVENGQNTQDGAPTTDSASTTKTLDTINVFGTLENNLSVGSKSGLSLRETPKSITVVTQERLEAQNLTSLMEALNQTTGVSISAFSPVDSFFFSRGFRVSTLQIDGGAPAYTGGFGSFLTPDTAAYDRIEMLRGVDGMYSGAGAPGGVINMVRKRAQADFQLQSSLSLGSWDNKRGDVDVTGPLGMDGRLRGRLVGAYVDKGYFQDRAHTDKRVVYGTAELDVTDSTLLIVGGSYEGRDESGYTSNGLPRYSDGRDLELPRSTNLAPNWSHWNFDTKDIFARVEQHYGSDGVVKLNATRIQQDSENRYIFTRGAVDPLTRTGPKMRASGGDFSSTQDLLDLSASGTFELFGNRHRYTVGADYSSLDGSGQRGYTLPGYTAATAQPVNVYDFNPSLYPEPQAVLSSLYPQNGQSQNGFYATVGIQITDPLRLTLGGRYSDFRYRQTYQPVAPNGSLGTASLTRFNDSAFIPSVALSFDFARDWTMYTSFAETFEVQAGLLQGPPPGTPLDPVTGSGLEFGVKGQVRGFLNVSAALFSVERKGQGIFDPNYPEEEGNAGSYCCYVKQANIKSQGLDAEISGVVATDWQVFAGYTYNKTSVENDPTAGYASGAYFLGITPKHLFKMWTTWQLPGAYSRWTLNGGVIAQSPSHSSGTVLPPGGTTLVPYEFSQSGHAVWNASVQYRLDEHWTFALYVDNLTDRTYYQSVGMADRENVYGTPRSYVFNARYRW